MSGISYGYSSEPVNVLRFDATLAFTFALRPDSDLKYEGPPTYIKQVSHDLTYWGYLHEKEFATIAINTTDILNQSLSIKDFEYLYLIVGATTKNFAIYKNALEYKPQLDRNSLVMKYTSIFHLDLATLFYSVPYTDWVFCKHVWEQCPEVLPSKTINEYSALYYALFISSKQVTAKLISNMESCSHLLNELFKYYVQSQKMLISNQVGEEDTDEEFDYIVSYIFPAACYCIFHALNVVGYREWKPRNRLTNLFEWLDSMVTKMQEDLYLVPDVQPICQIPNLAKDAIINRYSTFRKFGYILGENMKFANFSQK